jgi:hypothetical protein
MRDCVREAYDKGLNDGRQWDGDKKPYNGQEFSEEVGASLYNFVRRLASAPNMPNSSPDLTTFEEIAEQLDVAEIPSAEKEKPITLLQRVELLTEMLEEERGRTEELEAEGHRISTEFEGDLWRANRRILNRLGFDWSQVDMEGVTADTAEDFIMDALTNLERKARPAKKPLPVSITGESA